MPAQPFTVHVDPDELATAALRGATATPNREPATTAITAPGLTATGLTAGGLTAAALTATAGARPTRAARRSERARPVRTAGASASRSYAFRRS